MVFTCQLPRVVDLIIVWILPAFGSMSTDARVRLLMSDKTPKEVDNFLYRFLIQIFASRERRLESGLAGGRS